MLLQSFSSGGAPVSEPIQVNTTPADTNNAPAIAFLSDATIVVSWGLAEAFVGVRAQRFGPDLSKLGSDFAVNTSQGVHFTPAITALDDGGFVIGWQGGPNFGSAFGRYRIFNPDGSESVPEQTTEHGLDPGPSTLAPVPQGQFAAVHIEAAAPDRENILAVSLYGADGRIIGDGLVTEQDSQTISSNPAVRAGPTGGLVVTWTQRMVPTTGIFGQEIKARLLSGDLAPIASVNVNTAPRRGQDLACVTPVLTDSTGMFAFAWVDAHVSPPVATAPTEDAGHAQQPRRTVTDHKADAVHGQRGHTLQQSSWGLCSKCATLTFSGNPVPGICASGGLRLDRRTELSC